ncbi:hypothetical protein [Kutzneria buriramensis]|uniref:Uncharacterized protein n=1 Tax=Kutzneria buriramensis TaxID=1045776 RepID=A0A3E0HE59_9PSEU|nr:hypothetical protein [Kutzneria buriramensis]REH43500.1 hypothetical protein BCF44_10943 [Kutzneria buriramensis]
MRLVAGMVLAALALVAAPANALAAGPVPPTCTQIVRITGLAFTPPTVAPGGASAANLSLQNCTPGPEVVTATWTGRFVGADGGIPVGCPVLDPLLQKATLGPYGDFHSAVTYTVPGSCAATQLQVTVRIQQDTRILDQRTAALRITQP